MGNDETEPETREVHKETAVRKRRFNSSRDGVTGLTENIDIIRHQVGKPCLVGESFKNVTSLGCLPMKRV